MWRRKSVISAASILAVVLSLCGTIAADEVPWPKRCESWVPVRAITSGPHNHWFAYYDKQEFDPTSRYALGMEVPFENRKPEADDIIKVGMVDLDDGDKWIELGETRAWGWQQGCMLQWRPGSDREVLWNDREGDRFVCRLLDIGSRKLRTIPRAVYSVSPDGKWAVTTDFRRIDDMRPGYGYAGLPDPNSDVLAPEDAGIWRVDLDTGREELIISIAEVAAIPFPGGDISTGKHYFNHLLINTDGTRFEFLHRWRMPGAKSWSTRMLTAAPDGSDIRVLDDNGMTSHFIWRDPTHILAWSKQPSHGAAFYLFSDDGSGTVEAVGPDLMIRDGHCTYLPGNRYILNDSYPDNDRLLHVYLYDTLEDRILPLANVFLPPEYKGEWRIDTHPRFSPDGRSVVIDAAFEGRGRQMYLLDIGTLVE